MARSGVRGQGGRGDPLWKSLGKLPDPDGDNRLYRISQFTSLYTKNGCILLRVNNILIFKRCFAKKKKKEKLVAHTSNTITINNIDVSQQHIL